LDLARFTTDENSGSKWKPCVATVPNVLITFHTQTNNTRALAEIIASGVTSAQEKLCGGGDVSANLKLIEIEQLNFTRDVVEWADAVLLGSPTHYGNVASAVLKHVEDTWDYVSYDLSTKIGGVFCTSGAIHSGAENVLQSLMRTLFGFRFIVVGGSPQLGGQYSSYGATAITGTPPFSSSERTHIDKEFHPPAINFGERIVNATARYMGNMNVKP